MEKLNRETIRLSQVQDIAGCRVVVSDVAAQERVVASLRDVFPDASVVDRRANPSHGYRAVHVIAQISGKLVEIQVRTSLQHLWAELSEKLSDVADPAIKYGGGPAAGHEKLTMTSRVVMMHEQLEQTQDLPEEQPQTIKNEIVRLFGEEISHLETQKGQE